MYGTESGEKHNELGTEFASWPYKKEQTLLNGKYSVDKLQ